MKELDGSYTVEAVFVMAVVLFTIGTLIQGAFRLHDQVQAAFVLHQTVEISRRQEEGTAKPPAIVSFYDRSIAVETERKIDRVSGVVRVAGEEKQIEMKFFVPEEFLRLLEAAGF